MLGSQGLTNVSVAADIPWTIDKKTRRLIPNHNIYSKLFMNCFEEVRLSMLQESAKRIAGECHGSFVVELHSLILSMKQQGAALLDGELITGSWLLHNSVSVAVTLVTSAECDGFLAGAGQENAKTWDMRRRGVKICGHFVRTVLRVLHAFQSVQ